MAVKMVPLLSIEAHLGDTMCSSYSFLTSALEGGEWSASRPGRPLLPGKEPPVPTVQEAGWAPEAVWTQRLEEKILCLSRGWIPGRPVRSQTLYWLSYPAPPHGHINRNVFTYCSACEILCFLPFISRNVFGDWAPDILFRTYSALFKLKTCFSPQNITGSRTNVSYLLRWIQLFSLVLWLWSWKS
jgi:hypothetical protein